MLFSKDIIIINVVLPYKCNELAERIIFNRNHFYSAMFPSSAPALQASGQKDWVPPPSNWIKINSDAAFSASNSALAVVARNHHGEVIKAWSKLCTLGSPLITEASAIQWVMQLAVSEK